MNLAKCAVRNQTNVLQVGVIAGCPFISHGQYRRVMASGKRVRRGRCGANL